VPSGEAVSPEGPETLRVGILQRAVNRFGSWESCKLPKLDLGECRPLKVS